MSDPTRARVIVKTNRFDGDEGRTAAPGSARPPESSLADLRHLAAHLQEAREQERRAIAREIHDELGHQLTALKMDVVALERELQRTSSALSSRTASMKTLLDQLIGNVRRLSSDLRPGILDDFGLVAAIEWQVEAFEEHTGIAVELDLDVDDADLTPAQSTAMFRVLQESLTNVARHSGADRVRIVLRRHGESLHLEVRDDGHGFAGQPLRRSRSNGITGMRERVLALGGSLRIGNAAGRGFVVAAMMPVDCGGHRAVPAGLAGLLAVGPDAQRERHCEDLVLAAAGS